MPNGEIIDNKIKDRFSIIEEKLRNSFRGVKQDNIKIENKLNEISRREPITKTIVPDTRNIEKEVDKVQAKINDSNKNLKATKQELEREIENLKNQSKKRIDSFEQIKEKNLKFIEKRKEQGLFKKLRKTKIEKSALKQEKRELLKEIEEQRGEFDERITDIENENKRTIYSIRKYIENLEKRHKNKEKTLNLKINYLNSKVNGNNGKNNEKETNNKKKVSRFQIIKSETKTLLQDKEFLKQIINSTFQIVLVVFMMTLIIQQFQPFFINRYLDVNGLMIVAIILGILTIVFPPSDLLIKNNKITKKDYYFIGLLGITTFVIIKIKLAYIGILSWLIGFITAILIVLLSILILKEE